jgi:hypothetical protein
MRHAPAGYECSFCHLAGTLPEPTPDPAIVWVEPRVFAFVPLHHYAGIRGNCLIAPRAHYENVLDIPDDLGEDFFRATRRIANALQYLGAQASRRGSTMVRLGIRMCGISISTFSLASPRTGSIGERRSCTEPQNVWTWRPA